MISRIEGVNGMFSSARTAYVIKSYEAGKTCRTEQSKQADGKEHEGFIIRTLNRAGMITIQEISSKSGKVYEREPTPEELEKYKKMRIDLFA